MKYNWNATPCTIMHDKTQHTDSYSLSYVPLVWCVVWRDLVQDTSDGGLKWRHEVKTISSDFFAVKCMCIHL